MGDVWREYISPFEGFHHEVDEYIEVDSERVLVLQHFSGRGKGSGVDLERVPSQGAVLFHVRDGKVTRLIGYFDRERALAELGLSSSA
jgi:ketosteroid isomerase-like protein